MNVRGIRRVGDEEATRRRNDRRKRGLSRRCNLARTASIVRATSKGSGRLFFRPRHVVCSIYTLPIQEGACLSAVRRAPTHLPAGRASSAGIHGDNLVQGLVKLIHPRFWLSVLAGRRRALWSQNSVAATADTGQNGEHHVTTSDGELVCQKLV